jgi:hypothetical protein
MKKNKELYFTILEVGNSEAPNIGTIRIEVPSNGMVVDFNRIDEMDVVERTFTEKIIAACNSHFDADCKLDGIVEFSQIYNSYPKEFKITFDDGNESAKIEIQQSWLY